MNNRERHKRISIISAFATGCWLSAALVCAGQHYKLLGLFCVIVMIGCSIVTGVHYEKINGRNK